MSAPLEQIRAHQAWSSAEMRRLGPYHVIGVLQEDLGQVIQRLDAAQEQVDCPYRRCLLSSDSYDNPCQTCEPGPGMRGRRHDKRDRSTEMQGLRCRPCA